MSSDTVVRLEDITKCYEIYEHPRDRLKQFILPRLSILFGRPATSYYKQFCALKNISIEIKRGETVGIIGRNGAGKSTLLQIISGTVTPTTGLVDTTGRIAALLELGAGFNPEFTGRENIYFYASILGLSRKEIANRLDDIVAFADIGDHIDQPVKSYSSGMYVRLAFSVIAHVDADVLIVDEALAVGDAVFTQRCMRFIRNFQKKGTLIFVSHDIASVQNLCKTTIWIEEGVIKEIGASSTVAEKYLEYTQKLIYGDNIEISSINRIEPSSSRGNEPNNDNDSAIEYQDVFEVEDNLASAKGWTTGDAKITSTSLIHLDDPSTTIFKGGENVRLVIVAKTNVSMDKPILGFLVRDKLGQDLFGENTLMSTHAKPMQAKPGEILRGEFEFTLPNLPNGHYTLMASIANGDLYDNVQHHWLHDALLIHVSSSRIRWGLVGINFNKVSLALDDA